MNEAEKELCWVIAGLRARGHSEEQIRRMVAEFLVFQSLDRFVPVPKVVFRLDELPTALCVDRFRFAAPQILTLQRMLGVPDTVRSAQNVPVPGTEALCLVLRRLSYPCRYTDLMFEFGRQPPVLCSVFNKTLLLIHRRVSKKMEFDKYIFTKYAHVSAESVYNKVGYLKNCIAFIDGTMRRICRPTKHQEEVYSGFKKVHCLKYQGIMLANGLLVALHGPIEGRRHDSFMLQSSQVEETILELFPGDYIYGDLGYTLKQWLMRPFQNVELSKEETAFNKAMSSARVSVEWFFGEVVQYWAACDFKKGMKVAKSPIGAIYIVAVFLTNALMCARRTGKTASFFECPLPTLEEYLSNIELSESACGLDDSAQHNPDTNDDEKMEESADQEYESMCDRDDFGDEKMEESGNQDYACVADCDNVEHADDAPDGMDHGEFGVLGTLFCGDQDDIVAVRYGVPLTRRVFKCLRPRQWLNDGILNVWFAG